MKPEIVDKDDGSALLDALWKRLSGLAVKRTFKFDPDFYRRTYPDMKGSDKDCLAHYKLHGAKEGRYPNKFSIAIKGEKSNCRNVLLYLVTEPSLRSAIEVGYPDALELAYELISLGDPIDKSISHFSCCHYLSNYRDIERAGIDPLMHYVNHGHAERRVTLEGIRKNIHRGARAFDPNWRSCLICAHEFSQSGAPAVALDIAREASLTHNVIIMALRGGMHLDAFCKTSCVVVTSSAPYEDWPYIDIPELATIDFAIINSVEAFPFIKPLVAAGVPFASYIHEFADYILPTYKAVFTALFSNVIVFSSSVVEESWSGFLADAGFDAAQDVGLLAQASMVFKPIKSDRCIEARVRLSAVLGLDCGSRRIAYGAGQMQIRKGTDLFAMVAQQVKELDPDTLFIWIGDGANHEDIVFGVWLDKHLREAGANSPDGNLFVIPAGPLYRDVCAAADVLFLPSRLDPLPNVVFDAAYNGCSTVLFKGATGFDDSCYDAMPSLVRVGYGDLAAATRAILRAPRKLSPQRYRNLGDPDNLSIPVPVPMFDTIRSLIRRSPAAKPDLPSESNDGVSVLFRDDGGQAGVVRQQERRRLSYLGRRAIWADLDTVRRTLADEGGWMHARTVIETHADIPATDPALLDLPRLLVHVHAHYLDDLARDLSHFATYRLASEVIVTTDTDAKAAKIEAFGKDAGIAVVARVIPNQGRDILPFLHVVGGHPAADDAIWCHVHQKKSITSTSGGDVWREFLMRILMGDNTYVASAVQRIAKPGTGLVTAFDPYVVGWAGSRRLLPDIERRLGQRLPDVPLLFPIGNMFWTRAGVARNMLGLFGKDYPWPNEPLPNDGTIYHLIERLWPAVAARLDLETVFIDRPGTKRV